MSISRKLISATGAEKVYLVAANRKSSPNGGIGVFDITDPTALSFVGNFSGTNLSNPEKLAFDANRNFAVVGGAFGTYFSVFDLKNPSGAFETDDQSSASRQGFTFSPDGNYIYSGTSASNETAIFSVSSGGLIAFQGGYNPAGGFQTFGWVFDYDAQRNYLFGGGDSTYDRWAVVEVVSPTSLSFTSGSNSTAFDNVIRARHDDNDQILFTLVDTPNYELSLMNTSNPANLVFWASPRNTKFGATDFDVDYENKVVYVLQGSSVQSYDYSSAATITLLQELAVGSNNKGISYHDGYVFITAAGGNVYSVDVSNPSSMSLVDTISGGASEDYYQSAVFTA